MRTLFPLLVLGCRFEAAPLGENGVRDLEAFGRTSLGERITLTDDDLFEVSEFGRHVAVDQAPFAQAEVFVTEAAAGPCPRRVRSYDGWSGTFADTVDECDSAGTPLFGEDLLAGGGVRVTGYAVAWTGSSWWADISDRVPWDAGRSAAISPTWPRFVAFGTPSTQQVRLLERYGWDEIDVVIDAPGWLSDSAGFGSAVWVLDGVLVVGDAFGGFHFYYATEGDDGVVWTHGQGPAFDGVLAHDADELLVRRNGMADLEVLRHENGAWTTSSILPNAAGGAYTQWVMDDVAAFAVVPRDGQRHGSVDRYNRSTGELEASLALVRQHSGVHMALDATTLVVSEIGAGAVHVFDWTEDRQRLFEERGELHEEVCLVPASSEDEPVPLDEQETSEADVYLLTGDAGGRYSWQADSVWTSIGVPGANTLFLELRDPRADRTDLLDIELHVDGAPVDSWSTPDEDGVLRLAWHNFDRWDAVEVDLEIRGSSANRRPCTSFELRAELAWQADFCPDPTEPESWEDPPALLESLGVAHRLPANEADDMYSVHLEPGDVLVVERDGDASVTLLDAGGSMVAQQGERVSATVWGNHAHVWGGMPGNAFSFEAIDAGTYYVRAETLGRYIACAEYTLEASVEPPAPEAQ